MISIILERKRTKNANKCMDYSGKTTNNYKRNKRYKIKNSYQVEKNQIENLKLDFKLKNYFIIFAE